MASKYEISRADLAKDREQILAVWGRNLLSHDAKQHAERYDWICRNPTGSPRFWLVTTEDTVVGATGLTPRAVALDGRHLSAGIAGDFAVDAGHRILQPALLLQRAVMGSLQEGLDMIYGLPNPIAMKVFERQGYHRVGGLRRFVKVLRTKRFLKAAKGVRAKAAAFSGVLDVWLKARSADTWHRAAKGRAIEPVTTFDARFDDLWSRVRPSDGVLGVRDAAFLRWRYTDCPLQNYETFAVSEGGEKRLLGYVTAYSSDDEQMRITDLITDGSAGAVADLLGALLTHARRTRAASISFEFLDSPSFEPELRRFGFVERECDAALTVSAKPEVGGDAFLQKCAHWYFLRGDENVNTK